MANPTPDGGIIWSRCTHYKRAYSKDFQRQRIARRCNHPEFPDSSLWDREILQDSGKISAELAQMKAETEFEKYRVVQDALYQSDFDRFVLPTIPFEDNKQ